MNLPDQLHHVGAPTTQGEPSPDEYYMLIGKGLSKWEDLELAVASILPFLFSGDINSRPFQVARRTLGHIDNSATRIELVKAAMQAHFDWTDDRDNIKTRIGALFHAIDKLRGFRNKLAHGVVRHWKRDTISLGWWLMPAAYQTKFDSYQEEYWRKRRLFPIGFPL